MAVVLDSSIALSWCLRDQVSRAGLLVLEQMRDEGALVPAVWHMEMANILGLKLRSGYLTASDLTEAEEVLASIEIVTDEVTRHAEYTQHLQLMERNQLTAYDAAYLDVAVRNGRPLATFDRAMIASARTQGVPVLPVL